MESLLCYSLFTSSICIAWKVFPFVICILPMSITILWKIILYHRFRGLTHLQYIFLLCFKIQEESKKYYFVVANAKFMLDEEEHFKELMSERIRLYGERNREQDFWLVIEPKFLDNFPNITKRLKRPAVALVSTNGPWIT